MSQHEFKGKLKLLTSEVQHFMTSTGTQWGEIFFLNMQICLISHNIL